ncbi:MAG: hypothetical protein H0V82_05825 [Candidatus Protochlamydia sp.]|nr:hypothetical protein [Candidatus Protochlamydia sp.]
MINSQISSPPIIWNQQRIFAIVKSAGTITFFAAGILGSAALAHYHPPLWFKAAAGVACLSLYAPTKILRHGNSRMIRAVFSINLAALGMLSLGGASTALYLLARQVALSTTHSVFNTLISSFFFTGVAGYAIPGSLKILKNSYSLLNDGYWKTRCEQLQRHFNAAPEIGFGLLQTGLLLNARLIAAVVAPLVNTSFSYSPPEIEAITAATTPPGVKELNSAIDAIKALQFNDPLFLQKDRNLYMQLQNSLDPISLKEAETAGDILKEKATFFLLTRRFSKENYINLFHGPLLRHLNHNIDFFLDRMSAFQTLQNRFRELSNTLNHIEAELDRGPTEALKQQLDQINTEFMALRSETEKLYKEKKRWNQFFQAWGEENPELLQRFSQVGRLKRLIANAAIGNQLDLFHQTLYGLNLPQNQAFPLRIQHIFNRLQVEPQEEQRAAWLFLGTEQCNFIAADYDEVCAMLHVPSLNDLAAKFNEIGLAAEEDLYVNGILPREGVVTKEIIKHNLRQHIQRQEQEQASLRTRIYCFLGQARHIHANIIAQKVNQVIYRLCTMGLILVPVCIYPAQAAVGFSAGTIYFILRRFNWALSPMTENALLEGLNLSPIGLPLEIVTGRNFFLITENSRNRMETFVQADFFGRMRLLNFEIFTTFLVTLPIQQVEMGGFIQGLALAKEVSDLLTPSIN